MRAIVHHPEPLFDQVAFEWRLLSKLGDQLFHHVGIEDGPLHIFRSGIFAPLELQHLHALFGHRQCRRVAGHTGSDHDRIESLFNHQYLL